MPSPGEDIQSWSTTAANNGTADPLIVWSEGQARASVNNSSRSEMAAIAKWRNLLNGSIVTTGSPNAQQFLSGVNYGISGGAIPSGLVVRLKIGSGLTNTDSATLNMDGLGATLIQTADGARLRGDELIAGAYADLLYNGTNWIFLYSREHFEERMTGGGGVIIGKQIFSTPGTFTYTPTSGTEAAIIECIGAGAGGHSAGGLPVNQFQVGSGGGGGGYSRSWVTADQIGGSQTVTVGAGGIRDVAGGATSVGALCVANGGQVNSGYGGAAGTGDFVVAGANGGGGFYNNDIGNKFVLGYCGTGAPGPFGGGANAGIANGFGQATPGDNATGYGAGGGGAAINNTSAVAIGGTGSGGLVIITEFAGRGAPGRDGNDGAQGPPGPIGPEGPAGPGTGDVLVSGTPAAGQLAVWTDTAHITGIDPVSGFTTGDAKITLKTAADPGWVMMDDGTIGNALSGATTRANLDTIDLFKLLFDNISDAYAPLQTSSGAATTRAAQGGNATTAFNANCRVSLTKQLGRALTVAGAGAGMTSRQLGQIWGAENITLSVGQLPAHSFSVTVSGSCSASGAASVPGYNFMVNNGSTQNLLRSDGNVPYYNVDFSGTPPVTVNGTCNATGATNSLGGGNLINILNPQTHWNIMIKL